MTKKLTNLSDGNPKGSINLVDCHHCNGTGKIGDSKCPICNGVGQMTKSKAKKFK